MTQPVTLTLAEFLLARIAEDDAVCRKSITDHEASRPLFEGRDWLADMTPEERAEFEACEADREATGPHFVDVITPARVLAECEAKRRIVEDIAANYLDHAGGIESTDELAGRVLEHLALPYADHPDFRPEWRA